MRWLLDVNVLLALAWKNHVHHRPARAWFLGLRHRPWATCPLTSLGFLRLSCQETVVGVQVRPDEAVLALESMIRTLPRHEYWPTAPALPEALLSFLPHLVGQRQFNDSLLFAWVVEKKSKLASFDTGLRHLLPMNSAWQEHLEILEP